MAGPGGIPFQLPSFGMWECLRQILALGTLGAALVAFYMFLERRRRRVEAAMVAEEQRIAARRERIQVPMHPMVRRSFTHRRLGNEEIVRDRFPRIHFTGNVANDICAICLVAFRRRERVPTLACGHFFHQMCLIQILQRSRRCPVCRAVIPFDRYQEIQDVVGLGPAIVD